MIVIDATNLILGRLATYAAKRALLGEEVRIINAEKAVITGKKADIYDDFLTRMHRGTPAKGPFVHRAPERIVRRVIRGMLPYKKPRGREAFARVMCYQGVPVELKDKKPVDTGIATVDKLSTLKYIDVFTLSKRLGAKVE